MNCTYSRSGVYVYVSLSWKEISMDSGANLNIRGNDGKTALGWALDRDCPMIAEALRAAGGHKAPHLTL